MPSLLIHAELVLPIAGAPIPWGWVHVAHGRVTHCSATRPDVVADQVIELPQQALCPAPINVHTHLDLSALQADALPHDYVEWIDAVVAFRRTATAAQLERGLTRAATQLLESGTTIVGDCIGDPRIVPLLADTARHALYGRAFAECIGPTRATIAAQHAQWANVLPLLPRERWAAHGSPHALYTISPDALAAWLQQHNAAPTAEPLGIHCAESAAEWQLFTAGTGPLRALLDRFQFPPLPHATSPVQYAVARGGLPRNSLLIHCNQLAPDDIAAIAAADCTVAHCPESHAFFGHAPFPLEALRAAGVPIALGTDSLGNCRTLNMFHCLHAMHQAFPALAAEAIVRMATCHAAQAMRLPGVTGTIAPGAWAHLCAVPIAGEAAPYEHLLHAAQATFVLAREQILRG